MIDHLRSELLKLRSTRTTMGLVAGMAALVLLVSLLSALLTKETGLVGADNQRTLLGAGSVAAIFAALAGVLLVTSEYRYGTIRPTLLFVPRRSRVVVAKVVASLLAGIVVGAIGEGIGFGVGAVVLAGREIPLALSAGQATQLVLGTIAAAALWAGIGVGVGFIVRAQVGAVVGLLAWMFVVENLLFALVPSVGRFTPYQAQNALVGLTTRHLLPPVAGGVLLVGWTLVLALLGRALTLRRDVS